MSLDTNTAVVIMVVTLVIGYTIRNIWGKE